MSLLDKHIHNRYWPCIAQNIEFMKKYYNKRDLSTSSITGQQAHTMWFDDLEFIEEYKDKQERQHIEAHIRFLKRVADRKETESHDITKSDFGVTKNWWNNG